MSKPRDPLHGRWTLGGVLAAIVLVVSLAACAQTSEPPITGASCDDPPASASFIPGEILVEFARSPGTGIPEHVLAAGHALTRVRSLGLPGVGLYRNPDLDEAGTRHAASELEARPDVRAAHPNRIVQQALTPTDEYYASQQWSYPDISLPQAWDVEIGISAVKVAVLDTGMLMGHPDRPTHLAAGYDFVSSTSNCDGDGRDPDPQDPIRDTASNYHGSHVAGTIGAATNNDYDGDLLADGIAGTSWETTSVPVRVLGPFGSESDLIDAIIWSAGGSIAGVPANPDPAHVINMSLAGTGACSSFVQGAITQARGMGAVLVGAAGNGGDDGVGDNASDTWPANCTGVIAVGATRTSGERAGFSNWGSAVDVMAPGWAILSLTHDGVDYDYEFLSGTSMAAAHVSGVVALMFSVDPTLTPDDVDTILNATSDPLNNAECASGHPGVTASDCGAGKINAFEAVQAAQP